MTVAYFSTFTRVFEIAAGCLLALAVPYLIGLPGRLAPVLNWGGLALLIFSILYIEPTMPFRAGSRSSRSSAPASSSPVARSRPTGAPSASSTCL